ncbi:MAG: flavin reductase [Deltaproteobacteria bacterium]|nr:MAG: flavin reductase [Deltaproteobacteria bacterium]
MEKPWLEALGKMTYGIYVLTAASGETINGMIASWVSQVSYSPPLIMVAVHPNRLTHGLIQKSRAFALHVLASHQKEYLSRFKGPDPQAKFSSLSWEKGITGSPILKDCLAFLECQLRHTYSPGNHTLFIGEIVQGKALSHDPVLSTLDYSGTYLGKE